MLSLLLKKNIRQNKVSGLYEAAEAGSKFIIHPEMIDLLGKYFGENPGSLIADWYRSLDDMQKQKVEKKSRF